MISQSELREAANYDPETGLFTWRKPLSNKYAPGDPMGFLNSRGYVNLWIRGHRGLAHRFAWIYMHGELPEGQIDHINGDRRDNRISNLRVVSNRENSRNQRLCKNNQLGITGVYFRTNDDRWYASITVDKRHHLGSFKTLLDAAAARKSAELKYGFHPNHGGRAAPIARIIAMSEEKDAEILRLKAERDAAQARVAELERVLAPFAEVADAYDPAEDDSFQPWKDAPAVDVLRLTLGQHRAAKAALGATAPVAQAGQAPEGWKLVPLEPSAGMLDVAVSHALMVSLSSDYNWSAYMRDVWQRMLAAAPQPAGGADHE